MDSHTASTRLVALVVAAGNDHVVDLEVSSAGLRRRAQKNEIMVRNAARGKAGIGHMIARAAHVYHAKRIGRTPRV